MADRAAFRLGILTALWRRPRVAEAVLRHLADLAVPGVALTRFAVRSPEDPDPAPEVPGVAYVDHPNAPLSDKWNAGMESLAGRVDAVMVIGSDDFVSAAYVRRAVEAVLDGASLVRSEDVVFYDAATGRAARARMPRMGAGRVLSRSLLDLLDWRPWPDGLSLRLDGGMDRRIKRRLTSAPADRRRCRQVLISAEGEGEPGAPRVPPLLDVKTLGTPGGTSLWSFDHMTRYGRPMAPGEILDLCTTHYPAALPLLDMAKRTKSPKTPETSKPKASTAPTKTSKKAPKAETPTPEPTPERPKGLSGPIETEPRRKVKSGTHSAAKAAEAEAARKAEADEDAQKTGTIRLRALKNIPPTVAGTRKRVYRGREWDAPAPLVRRLLRDRLAEEVK